MIALLAMSLLSGCVFRNWNEQSEQWLLTHDEQITGIYFLEKYDPSRIPMLFLHGIDRSPENFKYLIERRSVRSRTDGNSSDAHGHQQRSAVAQ